MKEEFLNKRIQERKDQNAFRQLRLPQEKIDFCSNDYLGIVRNNLITPDESFQLMRHGSTGSRLLAGNSSLIEETERIIATFHDAESGLIFNSGYDANLGLLSCVPQRGDTIIYDYLCHASIRDGIRLGFARALPFQHNDIDDLERKIKQGTGNVFVVTESIFSMDGDQAELQKICELCESSNAYLIVDEAHATGIIGNMGEGLVQHLGLHSNCFARIHTFGKAVGCHGGIVLGSIGLRDYLINFCRPFIFSTALPDVSIMALKKAYEIFPKLQEERKHLQSLAGIFQEAIIPFEKLRSNTAIQGIVVPGNADVKEVAMRLQENNLDVRPILYPTVPKGRERLRIVLHSFNTEQELELLINMI